MRRGRGGPVFPAALCQPQGSNAGDRAVRQSGPAADQGILGLGRLEKEVKMTQAGQRLTAAYKEDHIEVDGFRIRYWESGPPRPVGAVVMLKGMTSGLSKLHDALGQKYRIITM